MNTVITKKKHNFFAGPAILPASVLKQATSAIEDFAGMGLSILEISHRSKQFVSVVEEAVSLTKELLGLDDNYEVLFLTGGASSQFYMAPMNLLPQDGTVCYINTGTWSDKAIKEAKLFGNVNVLASSKENNYTSIPKNYEIPADATYLHMTSNNTVFGTQHHAFPQTNVPIVCDMSSDIFSRPIDVNQFGMIYCGAQKNMGPAGVTLVIVNKNLLGKTGRPIPTMLDYNTHITKGSMFNTPPAFPIYVSMLTMRWVKVNGGVAAMAIKNEAKAKLLYNEIDTNPLFEGTTAAEDRSLMNVTFKMKNPEMENAFLEACAAADCVGVKGHRSVGGFRASIYNAMPIESVQVLVDVMKDFASKNA
ncbi:MAG: 3-phosphoserine/phosphohydroxythreonine transaminase [Saprospiraceae bacterium]